MNILTTRTFISCIRVYLYLFVCLCIYVNIYVLGRAAGNGRITAQARRAGGRADFISNDDIRESK